MNARALYAGREAFEAEMEAIWMRTWLFAAHESEVARAGALVVRDVADASVIVTRDERGTLHGLANTCRHRGTRLRPEGAGEARELVCPYHGWRYGLDGRCVKARGAAGAEAGLALAPVAVRTMGGCVYLCIEGAEAPTFETLARNLGPYLEAQGMGHARIAHRERLEVRANWKLVVENFRECAHCATVHPRYSATYAHVAAYERGGVAEYERENEAWAGRMTAMGVLGGTREWEETFPAQPHYVRRRPIGGGRETLSRDGRPCAPLMGGLEAYDGGDTVAWLMPGQLVWGANDHVVVFAFTPRAPEHTNIEMTWLVDAHAREGVDYEVEDLIWLWSQTAKEDAQVLEQQHAGVCSRHYRAGPDTDLEASSAAGKRWIAAQTSEEVERTQRTPQRSSMT